MVSIVKNQLLKHLSRYIKNLSSDKINISTFRGEGELSNLELDENVLTELLELPLWLRLTSGWCNHVSFRISWTKLGSVPITLCLDEVNITVETCEFGRSGNTQIPGLQSLSAPQGKYSFIHKVIDGITVVVNTVNVKFKSPAFTATVQMSRIRVESKTPKWLVGDLRVTRLKDKMKGLLLIFKELSWQTVRIEASSTQDKNLTPLRLLTNQARCRITIKKKLSDCSILASRLVLILDDLLWVLTDSQLKAALHFVDSLSSLIKTSTNLTQKTKAKKKLETLPEYQAQIAQQQTSRQHQIDSVNISAAQKSFNLFDVRETSYHFFSQRIDLHLCDDPGDGRSCHPDLNDGGALQISVQGFQIDYYPFHLARSDRTHWPKYREASVPPYLWLEQSLNLYKESLLNLSQPNRPSSHPPLERSPNIQTPNTFNVTSPTSNITSENPASTTPAEDSPAKKKIAENLLKLMTSCVVLRIEDFTLYRVTTSGKKQMPKEFISGDKDRYSFPPEISTLHAEFTYFYFPGDNIFPLPPSKIFIHVNPVQIHFHLDSVLWFNSFALNLHESLLRTSVANSMNVGGGGVDGSTSANEPSLMYMDVKMESIMPRIIFEASSDLPSQRDRPKIMQIQIARFALTNIREVGSSRADLAQALHSLQEGSLVFGTDFPSKNDDLCIVTDRILSHVAASDITSSTSTTPDIDTQLPNILTRYALWDEPRDVWCIKLDPIWIDFLGTRSVGANKSVPFIDAVPVTLWLYGKSVENKSATTFPNNDKQQQQQQQQQKQNTHQNLTKTDNTLVLSVANLNQSISDKNLNENNNLRINNNSNNINNTNVDNVNEISNNNSVQYISKNNLLTSKNNPFLLNDDYDDDDHYNKINIKPLSVMFDSDNNDDDVEKNIKNNENIEKTENTADIHLIAHVSNLVSVQIDHYQYLFLLRLSEEMTELTTFLSLDSNRILQKQQSSKSIIVGCCIPQVEVTFVMPSQTPGKESSGCDAESVLPDSASLGDDLHLNSNTTVWPAPLTLEHINNNNNNNNTTQEINNPTTTIINPFGSIETPSPITNELPQLSINNNSNNNNNINNINDNITITQNPNTHGYNVQILSTTSTQILSPTTTTTTTTAQSQSMVSSTISTQHNQHSTPTTTMAKSKNRNSITDNSFKEFGSSLISMKKGFSNFMTSIDSALKPNTSDDASDTFSVQSDISSDSDNYVLLTSEDKTADCMDVMFKLNPFTTNDHTLKIAPVEVASEVCEEQQYKTNMSSPSEPSEGSSWKRRDLVSMATFRLTTVELIRQNRGYLSSLKLQISALTCDECGAIPWDELQTKFGARCRAWNIASYNPEATPCIQLRLDSMLKPPDNIISIKDKKSVLDWFSHKIDVHVNDLTLDLSMSTVIGLGDLAEDERIPKPLPLDVLLKNLKINLMEDRPPVNITSPGPKPINLHIGKMFIKRNESGIFNIQPLVEANDENNTLNNNDNDDDDSKHLNTTNNGNNRNDDKYRQQKKERDRELLSLQLIMQQLKLDNDSVRKQLMLSEKKLDGQISSIKQDNDLLKHNYKRAQDYISELLNEKETLLDTIRLLKLQTHTNDKTTKKQDGNR